MIKSRTAPINIFLHLLLYFVKFCYILKNLVYIVIFVLLHLASYWKCSKKAPRLIQICTGFVDAVLRPKTLVNRVGILTQILIAVNYCFFIFQISTFNQEKKTISGSPHTNNGIYLLWSCFSSYVYLKDVYITMKGIRKILFLSVSRILIIYEFLSFTAVFSGVRDQRRVDSSESSSVHMGCSRTRTDDYWNTWPEF